MPEGIAGADLLVNMKIDPRQAAAEASRGMGIMAGVANKSLGNVRLPGLATLNKEARGLRGEFNQLTEASTDFGDSLTRGLRRIVALSAASAALFGVARAFQASITAAKDLEKSLKDINVILNLPSKQLESFGKDLFNVARNTKQSFEEVGKAAVEFARQGLGVEETLKRTEAALILVNLAGVSATDATETLTAAMNSFNKENLDAVQIVNKIVAVDAKFAVSAADLAEALRRVGSTAQDTGVGFDRLISLTTAAQQVTQRGGAVIGNALKTIFQRLQRSDTLDQLEQLGVQVREVDSVTGRLTGTLVPADKILRSLGERFKTLTQEQRAQVSEMVAGVYQGNIFRGILNGLSFEQSAYATSIGASDEAIRRNAALLETWDAKYKQAGETLRQVGANIGQVGFGDLSKNILDAFNQNSIVQALAGTGDEAGNEFGKIFIKAFADTIVGVGVPLLLGITLKVGKTLGTFATTTVSQLNPYVDKSRVTIEKQIDMLLEAQEANIIAINASKATQAQKEAQILSLFQQQNAALVKQAALSAEVSALLYSRGPGVIAAVKAPVIKAKFAGYIPSAADGLMDAVSREAVAIRRGDGGASPSARPVFLPGFKTEYGTGAVANTSEYMVPNFAGSGKAAIFNREMINQMGMPNGAYPIMSNGSVPNFQGGSLAKYMWREGQYKIGASNFGVTQSPTGPVIKVGMIMNRGEGGLGGTGGLKLLINAAKEALSQAPGKILTIDTGMVIGSPVLRELITPKTFGMIKRRTGATQLRVKGTVHTPSVRQLNDYGKPGITDAELDTFKNFTGAAPPRWGGDSLIFDKTVAHGYMPNYNRGTWAGRAVGSGMRMYLSMKASAMKPENRAKILSYIQKATYEGRPINWDKTLRFMEQKHPDMAKDLMDKRFYYFDDLTGQRMVTGMSKGYVPNYADSRLWIAIQEAGAAQFVGLKDRKNRNRNVSIQSALQNNWISSAEARSLLQVRNQIYSPSVGVPVAKKWADQTLGGQPSVNTFLSRASLESNKPLGIAFRLSSSLPISQLPPESAARVSATTSYLMTGQAQNQVIPYAPRFGNINTTGGALLATGGPTPAFLRPQPQLIGASQNLGGYAQNQIVPSPRTPPVISASTTANYGTNRAAYPLDIRREPLVGRRGQTGASASAVSQELFSAKAARFAGAAGLASLFGGPLLAEGIGSSYAQSAYPQDRISQARIGRASSGVGSALGTFGFGAQIASASGPAAPYILAASALVASFQAIVSVSKNLEDSIEDTKERFSDLTNVESQRIQTIQSGLGASLGVRSALESGASGTELKRISSGAIKQTREIEFAPLREAIRRQIISQDFSSTANKEIEKLVDVAVKTGEKRVVLSPENIRLVEDEINKGIASRDVTGGFSSWFGPRIETAPGVDRQTVGKLEDIRRAQARAQDAGGLVKEFGAQVAATSRLSELAQKVVIGRYTPGTQFSRAQSRGGGEQAPSVGVTDFISEFRTSFKGRIDEKTEEQLRILADDTRIGKEATEIRQEILNTLNRRVEVEKQAASNNYATAKADLDTQNKIAEAGNKILKLREVTLNATLDAQRKIAVREGEAGLQREVSSGLRGAQLEIARGFGESDASLRERGRVAELAGAKERVQAAESSGIQGLVDGVFQQIGTSAADFVKNLPKTFGDVQGEAIRKQIERFSDVQSVEEFQTSIQSLLNTIGDTSGLDAFKEALKTSANNVASLKINLDTMGKSAANADKLSKAINDIFRARAQREAINRPFTGGSGNIAAEIDRLRGLGKQPNFYGEAVKPFSFAGTRGQIQSSRETAALSAEKQIDLIKQRIQESNEAGLGLNPATVNAELAEMEKIVYEASKEIIQQSIQDFERSPPSSRDQKSQVEYDYNKKLFEKRYGGDRPVGERYQTGPNGELVPIQPDIGQAVAGPKYLEARQSLNQARARYEEYKNRTRSGSLMVEGEGGRTTIKTGGGYDPQIAQALYDAITKAQTNLKNIVTTGGADTKLVDPIVNSVEKFSQTMTQSDAAFTQAVNALINTELRGKMTGSLIVSASPELAALLGSADSTILTGLQSRLDNIELQLGTSKKQDQLGEDRPLPMTIPAPTIPAFRL